MRARGAADGYNGGVLRRALFALSLPLLVTSVAACGNRNAVKLERPGPPASVPNLDAFERGYNEFVQLPTEQRAQYRTALMAFLLDYLDDAVDKRDEGEALSALRFALALYSPAELRSAPPSQAFAERAHAVYRLSARRGAERPALLALAVAQRFGDDTVRSAAVEHWGLVESWMVDNGPYSTEPVLMHEELERALEHVAAEFPSPFVVQRLTDLYLARYTAARQGSDGRVAGSVAMRRQQITGYLLMRLHLRADDFDGALAAMERVELDMPVAKLRELLVEASKPRRGATALLTLAEQFVPDQEVDPRRSYAIQGWAIVNNLSRRAVQRHPKDAYAHLLRARAHAQAGLTVAAISHLRQGLRLKEDIFGGWQSLARLEQNHLEALAAEDPAQAEVHLVRVEALHARAVKLWADRPITPGLPEAFYTVAESLYQGGEVAKAEKLLGRSLSIEPVPNALDLLGTIALKRSELDLAQQRYEELAKLAYNTEVAQLQWEARARRQLGEIAMRQGDASRSSEHIRLALRHTNDLLARTTQTPDLRSDHYVERGELLFLLGDTRLAMSDFRKAAELDPGSVKAYADPLRYTVAHGYYNEARVLFRRAVARRELAPNLKLYFSLWLHEMALRRGVKPDSEVREFLNNYDKPGWGLSLAQHARGKLSYEDLVKRASSSGERAEAAFYEGLRRWRKGDSKAARGLMKRVLDSEMMSFFEYDMAQAYLRWDDVPKVARRPGAANPTP